MTGETVVTLEKPPEFAAQLPSGIDVFDHIMQLDGEMFRDIANRRTLRRVVKDIGGLYFSSMRVGLIQRDLYRFMKVYRDTTLRTTLFEDGKF